MPASQSHLTGLQSKLLKCNVNKALVEVKGCNKKGSTTLCIVGCSSKNNAAFLGFFNQLMVIWLLTIKVHKVDMRSYFQVFFWSAYHWPVVTKYISP